MDTNELIKFFTIDNKNGFKTIPIQLAKVHGDLYDEIIEWCEKYSFSQKSFKEKIYIYIFKLTEIPKCSKNGCNNDVIFTNNWNRGYRKYCSKECIRTSDEIKDKIKKTNLERHGYESPLVDKTILERIKQTNIVKYGYENVFSCDEIKNKIKKTNLEKYGSEYICNSNTFKEATKKTCIEKYGVDSYLKSKESVVKREITLMQRYGVTNPSKSKIFKNKKYETCNKTLYDKFLKRDYEIIKFTRNTLTIKHPDGHIFTEDRCFLINRFNTGLELSTKILHRYSSNGELEIFKFIQSLINFKIYRNKRKFLNGSEIDLYVDEFKIGFEFDGLYWHSSIFKDNDYHLNKTNIGELKSIKIIHIFEDEWNFKNDIVKSIIRSKFKIYENIIDAKYCRLIKIDDTDTHEFITNNSLFKYKKCNLNVGMFYENDLICIMQLNITNDNCEIINLCHKINNKIDNLLLKYVEYLKDLNIQHIFINIDRRYCDDELYTEFGFNIIEIQKPKCHYFKNNEYIRYFEDEFPDNEKLLKIYDCGYYKMNYLINQYILVEP